MRLMKVDAKLTNNSAREYLQHGAMRRLKVINRCSRRVFTVYPHRRETALSDDELEELCIVLHAFYGNVYGLTDNLAWVLNFERDFQLDRKHIGLYYKRFKSLLNPEFQNYLDTRTDWFHDHLKEFRDSISHRIPLYIPPYGITENNEIIQPFPVYSGSIIDGKTMMLHGQVLADVITINELVDKFCEYEFDVFSV